MIKLPGQSKFESKSGLLPIPVVFLVGPTATGKTETVAEIARHLPLEVISCDSMQAYRSMRLLTQAPAPALRKKDPHHLVETLSPASEYNAVRFASLARRLISRIARRKKIPFVVGGTGLYVTALLDGIFPGSGKDAAFRQKLMRRAARAGTPALHLELGRLDPGAAAKIHPNDLRRVGRAQEIIHTATDKISDLKPRRKGIWGEADCRVYGLRCERKELYGRIDRRVDRMFEQGVVNEVTKLAKRKLSQTSRMCLGVREIEALLEGRLGPEEARELLKRNTRRYAKRQISWFKRDARIKWIDVTSEMTARDTAEQIVKDLRKGCSV